MRWEFVLLNSEDAIQFIDECVVSELHLGSISEQLIDDRLAIEVANLTKEQRKQLNIEQGGIFIVNVEQDGAAAAAGIRKGDVIN